jgi:hypothetical protein
MASDFFNGTGLGWGGSLCAMVNYSRRCVCASCECVLHSEWVPSQQKFVGV